MKNIRTLLVVGGLIYAVITILLLMNKQNLYEGLFLPTLLDYFTYWMILGLFFLVGLIVVGTLYIRSLQQRYNQLDKEHAAIKAHLYDVEQSKFKEDEEAGRRIQAFRQSLDKGSRTTGNRPTGNPAADGNPVDNPSAESKPNHPNTPQP